MNNKYDIDTLVQRFKEKDKIALARLITLVENKPETASIIFKHFENNKNDSYIIGMTGSPGVGKSTLTSSIAEKLLKEGKSLGIISVDPTSPFTGGAFLGDRVRMTSVSTHPNIFIRSLASRGYRGGISRAVLDITLLYEAFGMDFIIIETVGVGQSEFDIYNLAYSTVVIMVPGYGDQIQIMKAGIIEIGDLYVVNKKDLGGEDIVAQIETLLDGATFTQSGWRPPVIMTNSITGEGVDDLIEYIMDHKEHLELSELLLKRKKNRFAYKIKELMYYKINKILENLIDENEIDDITTSVIDGGKFKIYEKVHDLFNNLKFERNNLE